MEAVVDAKYRPAFFLNGGAGAALAAAASSKKMRPTAAASVAWGAGDAGTYRECLKNHAASMGGFALDGCGEFMPAPESDPADPASLRCAACGCHRNFHRRLLDAPPSPPLLALPPPPAPPAPPVLQPAAPPASAPPPTPPPQLVREIDGRAPLRGEETPEDRPLPAAFDEETDEESDEGSEFDDEEDRPVSPLPAPAMGGLPPPLPGYLQPASHMLLALSTGAPSGASAPAVAPRPSGSLGIPTMPPPSASAAATAARKRFRSKFSPEQKQLMRALSERLGWRLQKRDEAVVEDTCREIGVTKAVFKVWMHNNKHNFVAGHSARRSATAAASAAVIATGGAAPILPPPHAAAVHPSVHSAPAPHPQPAAPVHADFNINGTASAADYFRIQPATATASGGSPQSC